MHNIVKNFRQCGTTLLRSRSQQFDYWIKLFWPRSRNPWIQTNLTVFVVVFAHYFVSWKSNAVISNPTCLKLDPYDINNLQINYNVACWHTSLQVKTHNQNNWSATNQVEYTESTLVWDKILIFSLFVGCLYRQGPALRQISLLVTYVRLYIAICEKGGLWYLHKDLKA